MKLTLYTTDGCHLCEQAESELQSAIQSEANVSLAKVDIAGSDDLIDRYGIRIPVIQLETASTDLGWPFSQRDIQNYLKTYNAT